MEKSFSLTGGVKRDTNEAGQGNNKSLTDDTTTSIGLFVAARFDDAPVRKRRCRVARLLGGDVNACDLDGRATR